MNGQIVLSINGNNVTVMGGVYLEKPESVAGVKLAKEIKLPCAVDLPITDFSTPTVKAAQAAMAKTIALLNKQKVVYVGCMGGFGRTGLFLSLLTKFSAAQVMGKAVEEEEGLFQLVSVVDEVYEQYTQPVTWVRENYHDHAVETAQQHAFINEFDFRLLLAVAKFL